MSTPTTSPLIGGITTYEKKQNRHDEILRKKIESETVERCLKALPESREVYHNKGSEEFESAYAYNSCLTEIISAIKKEFKRE